MDSEKVIEFLKNIPTFASIERDAGIPPQTISKILRGERKLSPNYLKKIIPVLKKYGYDS